MNYIDGDYGISKQDAVKKLTESGYEAIYDKGVVLVGIGPAAPSATVKDAEDFLKKIDYRMSHGFFHVEEKPLFSEALV